jgi:hypothetical protein
VLADRAALDAYLREHAARMRQAGIDRFGDRFRATRRILDAGQTLVPEGELAATCTNCEAELRGQYCANCGQRARSRMISLWELIREASDILTSLDSRLWRTVGLLLFRPGFLTEDYLLGRRARYIPPLRLFLGCSLLFFFLLAVGAGLELGGPAVTVDGEDETGVDFRISIGGDDADSPPDIPADAPAPAVDPDADGTASREPDAQPGVAGTEPPGDEKAACEDVRIEVPESWAWIRTWLTEERLRAICLKVTADGGRSFSRALLENIPIMMFVFLPVMAFLMKFAYPLSGRFYVEHLLFLVHFHAFFYLLLSLNVLAGWAFEGTALPDWPAHILDFVTLIYVPLYLYRAMRLVYKQRAAATLSKYLLLGIAYFIGLLLVFTGTLAVTALTL